MKTPILFFLFKSGYSAVALLMILLLSAGSSNAYGQVQQLQNILRRLPAVEDNVSKVDLLNRVGLLYRAINIDSCFYYSMQASHLATEINYELGQKEAEHLIAYTFFRKGLYAEALELYGKLLPFYEAHADTENIVRLYMDKAEVLNKGIVDKSQVVAMLQQAIQIGSKLKNDSIMADVYISYCSRNGSLPIDSMKFYLARAKEIATRHHDSRILLYMKQWDAHFLIAEGKRKEALPIIDQLITDARKIGNVNMETNAYFLMIHYYYYEGELEKALEYYQKAYTTARERGSEEVLNYILTDAIATAKEWGNKDEIIRLYTELEKVTSEEWEKSRKFISDYVQFNTIQQNNQLLMAKSEKRALWLVIVSILALVILLAFYLIMLSRTRKAKLQVEALNSAANLQVIAMEEAKQQAIREEQQRLGQDLHDSLSGSIAAIKHRIEILSMDAADEHVKRELVVLEAELGRAYETARNKSHEWFSAAQQEEQSFERQIKQLTDSALPDSRYQKEIHIDDHSLRHVNADTRITLLRIIQEGITNIIKHARAKSVGILIYEEDRHLQLVINDDGRGMDEKKSGTQRSALGMQSIKRRVQLLNGESVIRSGSDGTEITISIPLSVA